MKKISFLIVLLFSLVSVFSQERSLSGRISDSESKSGLVGTHLSISPVNSDKVIYQGITGRDGSFTIHRLPATQIILSVSYLGYKNSKQEINLSDSDIHGFETMLEPATVEVGEVVVSATRQDRMLRDVSLPMAALNSNRIEQLPAITTANLFQDIPGVNLARDGIWATSVNIRGLAEQRIVSLVDGTRIETATDIAAGLAMIDVNDIERIEVIKGSASSLYGTGAMGGVVNIITKGGHYHDSLFVGGSAGASYQTVNSLHSENASIDMANERWYVRLSGTYRDAGNTMTPEGELPNSQFTDNNISMKLGIKPLKNHELNLNYQRFDAQDVGIPGGSAFDSASVATYPKELRNMMSATYTISPEHGALSRLRFKYFHQYILRDVELKPNANVTVTPTGNHTSNGIQLQTDWNFGNNNQLIGGVDIWQRFLSTSREKNIRSGANTTIKGEVPIPDAWFTSGGLFIQDQFSMLDKRLNLTLGGRFDLINTRNDEAIDPLYLIVNGTRNDTPPNQRITFEANNINNYSWSLDAGALYHVTAKTDLTLNVSKAYRAPSIEERFKYIDLGSKVKLGDPNLNPEQGYFIDMGTRIWDNKFQFTANVFANSMSNLIIESPGIFIYNYSANPANFDTLSALINSNVQKALLYGFDASAGYTVYRGITILASAGYVRGINTLDQTDLPQIPPLNGRLTVRYRLAGIFSSELSANLSSGQDKIAALEKTSEAYASYDLGISSASVNLWNVRLEAFGGVQNITDKAYMNHLSTNRGIIKYEPGRNYYLKLRLSF
jgi:hemoglobin/transferrin/lactoferrin receptor protein